MRQKRDWDNSGGAKTDDERGFWRAFTDSFNFTKTAEEKKAENLLVCNGLD